MRLFAEPLDTDHDEVQGCDEVTVGCVILVHGHHCTDEGVQGSREAQTVHEPKEFIIIGPIKPLAVIDGIFSVCDEGHEHALSDQQASGGHGSHLFTAYIGLCEEVVCGKTAQYREKNQLVGIAGIHGRFGVHCCTENRSHAVCGVKAEEVGDG